MTCIDTVMFPYWGSAEAFMVDGAADAPSASLLIGRHPRAIDAIRQTRRMREYLAPNI
jgi:hypothetical protein